jgi:DNA-binding MarR family transcriptional regulator
VPHLTYRVLVPPSFQKNALSELEKLLLPHVSRTERLVSRVLSERLEAQFRIVGALLGEDVGLTQTELASRLGVSLPTLSVALAKLEESGAVARLADPADARAKRVRATAGGAQLRNIVREVVRLDGELVKGIDPVDLRTTISVLRTIGARLGK